jgi:hypothetical protein
MKKLNIHPIPTEDSFTHIVKDKTKDNEFKYYKHGTLKELGIGKWEDYHIYLTDYSPIKEGDWCVHRQPKVAADNTYNKTRLVYSCLIFKAESVTDLSIIGNDETSYFTVNCRKIIATTDPKLKLSVNEHLIRLEEADPRDHTFLLSQISQQDLPKIADALNRGVTSVGFEMECISGCDKLVLNGVNSVCCGDKVPKTKDGCIVLDWGDVLEKYMSDEFNERRNNRLSETKEKIYTKEEVEGLLRRLAAACLTVGGDLKDADITKTAQWIKDNLK